MQSLTFLQLYEHCKSNYASACVLLADMHRKFMYMQACLASSIITGMHALHPEALSHCGHGHDLTSVAKLFVINIADIRSVFIKTLASERFHQNTVAGVP